MIRFRRLLTLSAITLLIFSSVALFYTAQRVQTLEDQLQVIDHNLTVEKNALRVLKAEWQYLNSPARLEALAKKHLMLNRPGLRQKISVNRVPRMPEDQSLHKAQGNSPLIRWEHIQASDYLSKQKQFQNYETIEVPEPNQHPRFIGVSLKEVWDE